MTRLVARHASRIPLACLLVALWQAAPVSAQSLSGIWERSNGLSRVRFQRCGDMICGTVIWLKEPKFDAHNKNPEKRSRSVMGMRVFYDLEESGENLWTGKAYNTDDGEIYSGRVTRSGDQLFTSGCVLAGLVCTTVRWKRVQ